LYICTFHNICIYMTSLQKEKFLSLFVQASGCCSVTDDSFFTMVAKIMKLIDNGVNQWCKSESTVCMTQHPSCSELLLVWGLNVEEMFLTVLELVGCGYVGFLLHDMLGVSINI